MNITYHRARNTPCVIVSQDTTGWSYCIDLEHVLLAATTGCGPHAPGVLVCGYDYCKVCPHCQCSMNKGTCPKCGGTNEEPAQGWVVGHFEPAELRRIYRELWDRWWANSTIHDELVFELGTAVSSEVVAVVAEIMLKRTTAKLEWCVPLTADVEIGLNWAEDLSCQKF